MKTQRDRILAVLTERGEKGVYVYELIAPRPKGLGIAQYNARIKELRSRGYAIVNTEPGHFVLRGNPMKQDLNNDLMTFEQMRAELNDLRNLWEIASAKDRPKIEKQGIELREIVEKMEALI